MRDELVILLLRPINPLFQTCVCAWKHMHTHTYFFSRSDPSLIQGYYQCFLVSTIFVFLPALQTWYWIIVEKQQKLFLTRSLSSYSFISCSSLQWNSSKIVYTHGCQLFSSCFVLSPDFYPLYSPEIVLIKRPVTYRLLNSMVKSQVFSHSINLQHSTKLILEGRELWTQGF